MRISDESALEDTDITDLTEEPNEVVLPHKQATEKEIDIMLAQDEPHKSTVAERWLKARVILAVYAEQHKPELFGLYQHEVLPHFQIPLHVFSQMVCKCGADFVFIA